jgi:hypothetical protein
MIITGKIDAKSSIRFIMQKIPHALINIAPEMQNKFEEEFSDFTLEYINSRDWICCVLTESNHIKLSQRVVEIIWCASYSYNIICKYLFENQRHIDFKHIDFCSNPVTKDAVKLIDWAFLPKKPADEDEWPINLPSPIENPSLNSPEKMADELCLCAIAVILHHELQHVRLQQTPSTGADQINQEKDADFAAADWILGNKNTVSEMAYLKRGYGFAISYDVIMAWELYRKKRLYYDHPRTFDRLINILEKYVIDPNHKVWMLLWVTFSLHFHRNKLEKPNNEYDTYYECINAYAEILSKLQNYNFPENQS